MKTIFLGGTWNSSNWRDEFIKQINKRKFSCFNPVVDEWSDEARIREEDKKASSDLNIYVITPRMTGFYSIAEVVNDSNKRPKTTAFCVIRCDDWKYFTPAQTRSLNATTELLEKNGVKCYKNLKALIDGINNGKII
jgi:hypothetical protein